MLLDVLPLALLMASLAVPDPPTFALYGAAAVPNQPGCPEPEQPENAKARAVIIAGVLVMASPPMVA
jgi:hypothetical protein